MARHLLRLVPSARNEAHQWVDKALANWQMGKPWMLEIREPKRSDEQNAALWSLLGQITKQCPEHHGRQMTPELWKSVFMDALGHEVDYCQSLDGKRIFPLGHRSSQLSKQQFSDLLELILAWSAAHGLTIKHFDDNKQEAA
ncbi:recombination protein NinB [Brevundimonas sp.]|uniref:recombination protein NinB n=1 Tax=Brevundimonas sp. TaxID=1871086 RepID=UPI0028A138F7|nr:recombination protein NinB [Brevundimonas sp.]